MSLLGKILVGLSSALIGLLVGLTLLEGGLALVAGFWPRFAPAPVSGGSGLTVLCVGDSFTYGVGAPDDQSYPRHLASLLRNETGLEKVTVTNLGRPGINSSQVLVEVERSLSQVRPTLLLLLAGGANYFNLWGRGDREPPLSAGIAVWISRLRSGRLLLRLLAQPPIPSAMVKPESDQQFRARIESDPLSGYTAAPHYVPQINRVIPETAKGATLPPLTATDRSRLAWAEARIAAAPKSCRYYYAAAEVLAQRHHYQRARQWLDNGLSENSKCSILHYFMGVLLASVGDGHREGEACHRRGIAADPTVGHNHFGIAEIHAMRAGLSGDPGSAEARRSFALAIRWFQRGALVDPSLALEAERLVAHLRDQLGRGAQVDAWIRADLAAAVSLARDRGVRPVVLTYPRNRNNSEGLSRGLRQANRAARSVARRRGLMLVDLAAQFARHPERQGLFGEDVQHPNARGYQLMAQQIFQALVQSKIVPHATTPPGP